MPLEIGDSTFLTSRPIEKSVETIVDPIASGETASYQIQLTGPAEAAIANTDFTAITLTLVDEETRHVINDRLNQDVLGVGKLGDNNVVLTTEALLTWSIQSADTTFIDPSLTRKYVYYRAIFTFDFDIGAGAERGVHEVRLPIRKPFAAQLDTLS